MAQIATRFPDVSGGDQAVLRQFDFYRENVVLHAVTSRVAYAPHDAPLSLKTVLSGEETYYFDGARFPVAPGRFLVLNAQQEYASSIESDRPVRSFCIFFSDTHAASVADAALRSEERRLDQPLCPAAPAAEIRPAVLPDTGALGHAVARLRAAATAQEPSPVLVDQLCGDILVHLFLADRRQAHRAERIGCLRKPVRDEILRRLQRAGNYIRCHPGGDLTIGLLAGIACMAPHHFIRRFSEAYGRTPHQFITGVRMEEAARRLTAGAAPVGDIATDVGYRNPSAFSREFRMRLGLTPTAYRARFR